jgi:Beta-galactosidase
MDGEMQNVKRSITYTPSFEFLTGFEGTRIVGAATDVLETTAHISNYASDFELLKADGIKTFRACIPWHSVEKIKGIYDWSWVDRYLAKAQTLGLRVIADPLHHTSYPSWLAKGFADPELKDAYLRFLKAFAQRYPAVKDYTVMNEPFVTTWLAGHCGIWHPYYEGNDSFAPILINICEMICECSEMLKAEVSGLRLLHVDTCECHTALDLQSVAHSNHSNIMRFAVLDLILGKVDALHPLRSYLLSHGITNEKIDWFRNHHTSIDVLGVDYYPHSERAWTVNGGATEYQVKGFKTVALEYAEHLEYQYPIMLTETNIRGRISDRLSWLKYMVEQCEELQQDLAWHDTEFLGFCWYPYIDSTDWCHLVSGKHVCSDNMCCENKHIDPQGIVWLDSDFNRHRSELSRVYAMLAAGQINAQDIPAYRFEDIVLDCNKGRMVKNYLPHLKHWKWQNPASRNRVTLVA